MINTPFSSWPNYSKEEILKVGEVLKSNKVNYWTGSECKKFESEFASLIGAKYAIALSNGTVAIEIALKALGICYGDEVIVTSRTFIASASSIVNVGATPVFVDVRKETQNIDPNFIRSSLSKKTKAIICVHLAGWPCDMDEIKEIAEENDLFIIEDCAQAHGAHYKGDPVGSIGDIGCWSFCQDKIMTTGGEGGMVNTNNSSLYKKMWSLKDHGKSYDLVHRKDHIEGFRWLHDSFGSNYRMTEMQAAIGRIQIHKLEEWTQKRNLNKNKIYETCMNISSILVPRLKCLGCSCELNDEIKCIDAAYKCYVFVDEKKLKKDWSRDKIIKEINLRGVPCYSGSCSEVYLEKAFTKQNLSPQNNLKNAKELGAASLMFLIHPTLLEEEMQATCDAIKEVMNIASA
jgi:dTDP-4-amino-4,6-dideoxygalactose transaminase